MEKINPYYDINIKYQKELLWAQIFNDTIRDSEWLTKSSFSPGRWAAGYPMLYIIYRTLNDIKPRNILEFGLGESSKLTSQYASFHSDSKLEIIEQDPEWLNFICVNNQDLKNYVHIIPTVTGYFYYGEANIYQNLLDFLQTPKYDFIIIDGPIGTPGFSRPQIIDIVEKGMLASDFVIIMDDYNRDGEKKTIEHLLNLLTIMQIEHFTHVYSGLKESIVICSKNNRYLTSL